MVTPRQVETWWPEAEDKRRPVLVVTRSETVQVLGSILVAPVTRMVRHIPTEVSLGESHGLSIECVASFDNLQPIRRSFLTEPAWQLGIEEHDETCRALAALADCRASADRDRAR